MIDPVDNVIWRPSRTLNANDYNPNVVFTPELRLLEANILKLGWVQSILLSPGLRIIDGFHRWRLSMDSAPIRDRWAEEVPTSIIECSEAEAMMITIRMNRAKGTHVAVRMSAIVQSLVNDHGLTEKEVREGIGASGEEFRLLVDGGLLKHRDLGNYKYSNAWVPVERPAEDDQEFEREDEGT